MADFIAAAALEKKAIDVAILDLRKLDALTDFFVICTGEVDQHVRAIADHIQDEVKQRTGDKLLHREGRQSLNWVLLDYVDVVVHVFRPAFREYYRLEDLWSDADLRVVKDKDGKAPPKAKPRAKAAPAKSGSTTKRAASATKRAAKPAVKNAPKPKPKSKSAPVRKPAAKSTKPAKKKSS